MPIEVPPRTTTDVPTTTIRPGGPSDEQALARLSALEDRHPGSAPHLVAEQDGEIVASLSLRDGVALGDPFRPTTDVVALLRAHGTHLAPTRPHGRRLSRRVAALVASAVVVALATGSALAATGVSLAGTPVTINPQTKAFTISVSCASQDGACEGVLDIRTAEKIKPYSSPAKIEKVGAFPFTIAAGATAKVKGRVYGPALAEAASRGKVRLRITPRATSGPLGSTKVVLFTYKRR